jgi:hypothetical protein
MRSWRTVPVVLCVVAVLAVAACGSTPPGPAPSASAGTSGSRATGPTALVGSWHVTDAAGAEPGTVLSMGVELTLWQRCGYLMGSWRAGGDSLFAANLVGGDGACFTKAGDPTPEWLRRAWGYAVDGGDVTLLAGDGTVVARLRPGASPTPGPHILGSLAVPPVLTAELAAALAPAAPLPAGLAPATRAQLVGSWVPAQPRPSSSGLRHDTTPGVTLAADGSYHATDGCNGTDGRWAADDHGALVATGGATTAIGCDNVPVEQWLATATSAGFAGTVLVLVGRDGTVTGRLTRA